MRFPQLRRARWAALLAALAVLSASPALAQSAASPQAAPDQGLTEEQVTAIAFDVLVLRPMGFAQTFLGALILPIAWVLAVPGELENEVIEMLVYAPARYTFERPLGDFS